MEQLIMGMTPVMTAGLLVNYFLNSLKPFIKDTRYIPLLGILLSVVVVAVIALATKPDINVALTGLEALLAYVLGKVVYEDNKKAVESKTDVMQSE